MPLILTDAQIAEIARIIRDRHTAFIVSAVQPAVEDAYLYGHALAASSDPKVASLTFEQFKEYLRKNPIPLGEIERAAVDSAQHRAAQYVRGLGNRIDQQTGHLMIEADQALRQQLRDVIKDEVGAARARRASLGELKSNLGWASRDWARDWNRIAVTETHNAMQDGVASYIGRRHGGEARVFKRPMPDACEHCKRLYLGPDGHPRIFKLSYLEGNGSNAGRKVAQWLPTVGATHPHCQCMLVRVPAGWGFNEDSELVPGGKLGVEYKGEGEFELSLREEGDLRKALRAGGYVEWQGIPVHIENPAGTVRPWVASDGSTGETRMLYAYGEILATSGIDNDPIDVYLGPDPKAAQVFIIEQQDANGRYDEAKCMLGFATQHFAVEVYRLHMDKPALLAVTPMDVDHFKRWIEQTGPAPGVVDAGAEGRRLSEGVDLVIPLEKSSALYLGPQGGKYADPAHSISWRPDHHLTHKPHPTVDVARLLRGSFGIKRIDMPQISSVQAPVFLQTLQDQGVHVYPGGAAVGMLKPTQGELHADKIQAFINDPAAQASLRKPVIVSQDSYILDGHHRWAALYVMDPHNVIGTINVSLPIGILLERARAFAGAEFKKADTISPDIAQGQHMRDYASHDTGTGANYLFNAPQREPVQVDLGRPGEVIDDLAERSPGLAWKREDFEFHEPLVKKPTFELPADNEGRSEAETVADMEARKARLNEVVKERQLPSNPVTLPKPDTVH